MAAHWGNEGKVRVSGNAVALIDNWSFTRSRKSVEKSAMGDDWKSYIPASGMKEWQGQLECHWDETDATGQTLLGTLPSITLDLCPEGYTTGDVYFTGTAEIEGETLNVQKDGSTIRASFSFTGNGALSESTVA